MSCLTRRTVLAGSLLSTGLSSSGRAATGTGETVTWIVPFPAGGQADLFARPIAQRVSERIGQTIVVDNRGGAGGTIGAAQAARAPADGTTFLVALTGHAYAPLLYPEAGGDLARSFAPISALARVPNALVVNPGRLDVATVAAFAGEARKAPDAIDVASSGYGTTTHLGIEMLQRRAGIALSHVPYRGGGPALRDLLGGQVAAGFLPVGILGDYVRRGDLRVLAVAARRRDPQFAAVPTMDEAGFKGFNVATWFGLFAPAATAEPILDRMHAAVQEVLAEEAIRSLWRELSGRVEPESRADFRRFVGLEIERWGRIVREANVQPE